jgi:hypothetical protein
MDGDRKYRQHGYQDSDYSSNGHRSDGHRTERPKQQGPKLPLDVTGPKLPRLVQNVVASRCFNCAVALPSDMDFKGSCPKCHTPLHCCKQCVHFEPSTRFQCTKPVPVRIPSKDQANTCELFSARITVARDVLPEGPASLRPGIGGNGQGHVVASREPVAPRTVSDARAAFDSLFKK